MVDAGLAMVQSLQALAEQTTNKVMRDTIQGRLRRVEGGDSFSEALQKHPKTFSRLYVCMVAAGERGGLLAEILARLATYLENTSKLRKKVKSAMMYPAAVTIIAIGITIFLLIKVVPVFGDDLQRIWTQPACADARSVEPQQICSRQHHLHDRGDWRGYLRLDLLTSRRRKAVSSGTARASACRSSAKSRTRSAWPGLPARWLRSFAPACPFSKSCRSFPTLSETW